MLYSGLNSSQIVFSKDLNYSSGDGDVANSWKGHETQSCTGDEEVRFHKLST